MVTTPIKLGHGTGHGDVTAHHVAFYTRGAGGAGLMSAEPLTIHP